MRPRRLRRLLALMAFGAILSGTGVGWAARADATPASFLNTLTSNGIVIYDTAAALNTGYAICETFNEFNGEQVAQALMQLAPDDVPTYEVAAVWVVAAGANLCPEHFHPERGSDRWLA